MNVESTGWRLTYPSEKYDSQLGVLFPIYGEKNMFQTTSQYKWYEMMGLEET